MASKKNDLIEIRMRLIGAKQVAEESSTASKGVKGVGEAASFTGTMSMRAAQKSSLLTRAYGGLKTAAKYAFGAIAIGGGFALKSAIDNTLELSKTTVGLVRNLGLHTNVASRWATVMHARGIDAKAANTTFAILSSKMVEASRKGGTALTAFHQLGITQGEVTKGAHNFQWGLMRIVKALGDAKGGAVRMTAAKALMGKGYQALLPLFSRGAKGLKEELHWADKYGITLDSKTNKAIFKMVEAQRQSKVAMLALQVGLTKALLPAITGAEDQFQTFVRTLNDPKLSADQKIGRIERQFEALEDTLIGAVEKALPKVAENGGRLGLKLADAVWHGFENSSLIGKLVISAWLLKYMGGGGLIKSVAGTAGAAIARGLLFALFPALAEEFAVTGSLGLMLKARWSMLGQMSGRVFETGFILAIPLLAYELASLLPQKTKTAMYKWGINAGQNFVNALIWVVNQGIDSINGVLNKANALAFLGVKAPQIGHIGEVNFHSGTERQEARAHRALKHGEINGPGGSYIKPKPPKSHNRRFMGGGDIVLHNHIFLDGKKVAESVQRHAEGAAALA